MIDAPSVTRYLDDKAIADAAYAVQHQQLMSELIDAIIQDPDREVSTPGFRINGRMSAADVVNDQFASRGDRSLSALLRIVGSLLSGHQHMAHMQANAWLAQVAKQHADFHAGEA